MKCKNCNFKVDSKKTFCGECGTPLVLRKIDKKYVFSEIKQEFLFEKGYLFTAKEIFLYPSKSINNFLSQNRGRITKPIIFFLITSIIFSVFMNSFHYFFPSKFASDESGDIYTDLILMELSWGPNANKILNSYLDYVYFIWIIIMALILKLFFLKGRYNFYEIALSLCYIISIQLLIIIPFRLYTLFNLPSISIGIIRMPALFSSFYSIWAINSLLEGRKVLKLIKVVLAYSISYIAFIIFLALTTIGIAELLSLDFGWTLMTFD